MVFFFFFGGENKIRSPSVAYLSITHTRFISVNAVGKYKTGGEVFVPNVHNLKDRGGWGGIFLSNF